MRMDLATYDKFTWVQLRYQTIHLIFSIIILSTWNNDNIF